MGVFLLYVEGPVCELDRTVAIHRQGDIDRLR